MKELVSILIPNFNKAPYLRETLDSILAQTYTNWECIIIDDHSTDASISILQEHAARDSRFRVYSRPVNIRKGACACRNYAFSLAKGEFVNWFDSDDIMDADFLKTKVQCLAENSEIDFAYGRIVTLDADNSGEVLWMSAEGLSRDICFSVTNPLSLLDGSFWLATPLPLFRRKFLEKADSLFDTTLCRGQETDFFIRLIFLSSFANYVPNSVVFWGRSPGSITGNYLDSDESEKVRQTWPMIKKVLRHFRFHNALKYKEQVFFSKVLLSYLKVPGLSAKDTFDIIWSGLINSVFRNTLSPFYILLRKSLTTLKISFCFMFR